MNTLRLAARSRNRGDRASNKPTRSESGSNRRRLTVEGLEPRLLLYAANGGVWPHPELVTVSFMPDGTDLGGVPNNLQSSMNLRFPTATWQKETLRGLQSYAANANLNFSVAADDGSPFGSCGGSGSDCNMQGDSNFGDVRIGGLDLGGALGLSMLPPPLNGDTQAGDFFLDTTTTWNIGASFDLFSVAAHEAGHSIGLDHSTVTTAVMYYSYIGVNAGLTSDDIAGIQSIYGSRPQDSFDAASPNNVKADSTVITSYIDSNKQVTLSGRDITTNSDIDWYKITTPSGSASTMEVRVQSTGLSLIAPKFTLYKGSTNKGTVSGGFNSTVTQTETINNGQNWYVKVEGAESGVFGTGTYALQINMGTAPMPPVSSPNTATAATGGGGMGSPIEDGEGYETAVAADTTSESSVVLASSGIDSTSDDASDDEISSQTLARHARRAGREAPAVFADALSGDGFRSDDASRTVDELLAGDLIDAVLPGLGFLGDLTVA